MSGRNTYMDILNIVACFAVVVLHCTTSVFLNTGDYRWCFDVILQASFLFAVPIFFMISGANLIGYRKRYSTKEFFRRRFSKVLITLVGYSALYYLLGCFAPGTFGLPARRISLFGFVEGLFTNSICDVYWFMYAILILYAITPLLSRAADDERLFTYITGLSVISTVIIPFLNRFAPNHELFSLMQVPHLSGWIMYYLLGYYFVHINRKHFQSALLLMVSVVSVGISAYMTIRTNTSHTVLSGAFSDFDSFYLSASGGLTALFSSCLFLLFKQGETKFAQMGGRGKAILKRLSSLSFGVYAIHMLIINTLDVYVAHSVLWDICIRPIVVFSIALFCSFAVQGVCGFLKHRFACLLERG